MNLYELSFLEFLGPLGIGVVVLLTVSVFLQSGFQHLFNWHLFEVTLGKLNGMKFPITLGFCYWLCDGLSFDFFAIVFQNGASDAGIIGTTLILSGGSAAAHASGMNLMKLLSVFFKGFNSLMKDAPK